MNTRTAEYTFQKLTGGAGGIIHDRPQGGLTRVDARGAAGRARRGGALIAAGADLNAAEPQYGFTAMQTAIFNGHYAFAKLLIEKGANVNDGSLYIVIEMRNLAKYTNRPNPPDAENGVSHLDVATLLLAKGADPQCGLYEDRFRHDRHRATSTSRPARRRSIARCARSISPQ